MSATSHLSAVEARAGEEAFGPLTLAVAWPLGQALALHAEAGPLGGEAEVTATVEHLLPTGSSAEQEEHLRVAATASFSDIDLQAIGQRLDAVEASASVQLKGRADARLQLAYSKGVLKIGDSHLRLKEASEGWLSYRNPGWLTAPAGLDISRLLNEAVPSELMQHPMVGLILPEAAMQDLTLTRFELRLADSARNERPLVLYIEGSGPVKGIMVPVVLTLPIGPAEGIAQTLNLLLNLKLAAEQLSFGL